MKGRQITLYGRRMDMLFEDRLKRKLIIELKVGPIKDEHIGQILAYEGMLLSSEDPSVRVMLVGNRVPPNLRRSLDHHGIAWKEITTSQIETFLSQHQDRESLVLSQKRYDILHDVQKTANLSKGDELPNSNKKIGLLFHCSFEEKSNIDAVINHLSAHEELYWSMRKSVNRHDFPCPYTKSIMGLINMRKKIVARCSIQTIKDYEPADHRDSSKKPLRWIEEEERRLQKLKKLEKREGDYRVTLVIVQMERINFEYFSSDLKDKDGSEIGRITQNPRTVLIPPEFLQPFDKK